MSTDLVSIGVPVYNGAHFLRRALDSLLMQTCQDFEILISDNGSTDTTEQICREYRDRDRRIRYFRHDRNRGASWNHNFTVLQATGSYFKWASHDDECAPAFLQSCIDRFRAERSGVVLCYPKTLLMDDRGTVAARFLDRLDLPDGEPHRRLFNLLVRMRRCNAIFGVIDLAALKRTGLLGAYAGADKVLLAQLCLQGRFCELSEHLFLRRMHANMSTMANPSPARLQEWFAPGARTLQARFPGVKVLLEYMKSIVHAELPAGEKLNCLGALFRRWRLGNRPLPVSQSQTLLTIDKQQTRERASRAAALLKQGELPEAEALCRDGLDDDPYSPLLLAVLAQLAMRRDDPPLAMQLLRLALWRQTEDPELHNMLGVVNMKSNRLDAAARCFRRALQIDGDYTPAWVNLGATLRRLGREQLAQQAYARAAALREG
jgi:tetratricopeptide (TPR) repeat protein